MLNKGISIYPGLDNTLEENRKLIKKAAKNGINRIFTSLQIPETNRDEFQTQLEDLLACAKERNMDVIADITPGSLELLGLSELSLEKIHEIGLGTLRLDNGFSLKEITELSKNPYGIKLQLNTSTLNENDLLELSHLGCDLDNVEALHNFYPRENSGLAEDFAEKKTKLFHDYGIKVGAFVPSFNRTRSPLKAGLPTVELHRETSFSFAIRHLVAIGVDSIIIGDSLPSDRELTQLGNLSNEYIAIAVSWYSQNALTRELLQNVFTARPDEARDVFRTCDSRSIAKKLLEQTPDGKITVANAVARPAGTVTLDNHLYRRYEGGMQITKVDLPADERVNVLGHLSDTEQILLKYIKPYTKFKFI